MFTSGNLIPPFFHRLASSWSGLQVGGADSSRLGRNREKFLDTLEPMDTGDFHEHTTKLIKNNGSLLRRHTESFKGPRGLFVDSDGVKYNVFENDKFTLVEQANPGVARVNPSVLSPPVVKASDGGNVLPALERVSNQSERKLKEISFDIKKLEEDARNSELLRDLEPGSDGYDRTLYKMLRESIRSQGLQPDPSTVRLGKRARLDDSSDQDAKRGKRSAF